jgi:hypothetical protein
MHARTLGSIALLVAGLVGAGLPRDTEAATCDALVGKWAWFTGGVVSINADGTIRHDPGNDGIWECTDRARGQATLRWRLGGYVNRLVLSGDGRALSSIDPTQSYVTAKRVDAPRPAEPPRRVEPEAPKAKAPESPPRPDAPRDTSTPARAAAVPCSGTACRDLASDPSPCKLTNTGTKVLKVRGYSGDRVSVPENPMPPGRVFELPGCATLTKIEAVYQTELFASDPKGEAAGPGPCSGDACINVRIMTTDGCVWIRSSAQEVVYAELRLQGETVTMTLEEPDATKAVKVSGTRGQDVQAARQAAARKRLDELRQKGMNIPYDPKVEGPRSAPGKADAKDKGKGWHGTMYDAFSGTERPVFNARVDRAAGCVAKPEEILSYRVTLASSKGKEAEPARAPVIACVGEACADLDHEQVGTCQLTNRGGREIVVGIVRKGNSYASVSPTVGPAKTMRLPSIVCIPADEIGRIEARYK